VAYAIVDKTSYNLLPRRRSLFSSYPRDFAAFLGSERDKWAKVVKQAGIRAE
jgi:hypothetical protein